MPNIVFEDIGKDEVTVAFKCPFCENVTTITVPANEYIKWATGEELVQNCFKSLGPDERELFITGMCFDCQSDVFEEKEEDE